MPRRSRLEQLGFDLEALSDEQLAALDALSDEEVALLVQIKQKLDDAGGDVEAHALDGGGLVW